ncbi:hypothetical protein NSTCB13_07441 [Nostoc sp. DSM 114160]
MSMKNLVSFITFFPLLLGFILAAVWWTRDEKNLEPILTGSGIISHNYRDFWRTMGIS